MLPRMETASPPFWLVRAATARPTGSLTGAGAGAWASVVVVAAGAGAGVVAGAVAADGAASSSLLPPHPAIAADAATIAAPSASLLPLSRPIVGKHTWLWFKRG